MSSHPAPTKPSSSTTQNPNTPHTTQTFSTLYTHLRKTTPFPSLPQKTPHHNHQTPTPSTPSIASLSLHPTLETILHILHPDLPSAHFLVRHMSAPPALEGMMLHAILHRVEGDFENARGWYAIVAEGEGEGEDGKAEGGFFRTVWPGGVRDAVAFVGRVEGVVKRRKTNKLVNDDDEEEKAIQEESWREMDAVVEWCRRRFGEGEVMDASGAWVRPMEKHRKIGEEMVVGGEGWRVF